MENPKPDDNEDRHEQARELTEKALDAFVSGDEAEGKRLTDEAKEIDQTAVMEVLEDLEEDAGADPDAVKQDR